MLVYNTNPSFLNEVQVLLAAFQQLRLSLRQTLPKVSPEAFAEAKRCWINQRTHIRDRLIEDIEQFYLESFALAETSTFVFLEEKKPKKGKKAKKIGTWKKKIVPTQLQSDLMFFLNLDFLPKEIKSFEDLLPLVKNHVIWPNWELVPVSADSAPVEFVLSKEVSENQNLYELIFRNDIAKISKSIITPIIVLGFFTAVNSSVEAIAASLALIGLLVQLRIAGLINKFGVFQ